MTKKSKPKERWWVSRDEDTGSDFHDLHYCCEKPVARTYTGALTTIEGKSFRELFTLKLGKGMCKEIERPQLVLKQKGLQTFTVNLTRAELVVLQDGDQSAADMVIDQILEQAK